MGTQMTWGHYLFGFRGRLNRSRYWAFVGLSMLFFVAVVVVVFATFGLPGPGGPMSRADPVARMVAGLAMLPLYLTFLISSFAVATKRLHDRAKSGWWLLVFGVLPALLNFAALGTRTSNAETSGVFSVLAVAFSIWGFVEMGCLRGTEGSNRFGPDPLAYAPDVAAATFN